VLDNTKKILTRVLFEADYRRKKQFIQSEHHPKFKPYTFQS